MKNLSKAAQTLSKGKYSCVIEKDGVIISARRGLGVKPILSALENYTGDLNGASVADTVTGKASAMLLHLGNVQSLYSQVASRPAQDYLTSNGILHEYGIMVDAISNRTKDGLCPIEQCVIATNDPSEGYKQIKKTIGILMSKK